MPTVPLIEAKKNSFMKILRAIKPTPPTEALIEEAIEHDNVRLLCHRIPRHTSEGEISQEFASNLLFIVQYIMDFDPAQSSKYVRDVVKFYQMAEWFCRLGLNKDALDYFLFESNYEWSDLYVLLPKLSDSTSKFLRSQSIGNSQETGELFKRDLFHRVQALFDRLKAGYNRDKIESIILQPDFGARFEAIDYWQARFPQFGYIPDQIFLIASEPGFEARFEAIDRWQGPLTQLGYTLDQIFLIASEPDFGSRFEAINRWHHRFIELRYTHADIVSIAWVPQSGGPLFPIIDSAHRQFPESGRGGMKVSIMYGMFGSGPRDLNYILDMRAQGVPDHADKYSRAGTTVYDLDEDEPLVPVSGPRFLKELNTPRAGGKRVPSSDPLDGEPLQKYQHTIGPN